MKQKGFFITIEGIEGAGKSSCMQVIEAWWKIRGYPVVLTREPGGTTAAENIRSLLLAPETGEIADETELMMMFAARADHLEKVIWPALKQGKVVLCDRFTDSSYAYQGNGRGIDMQRIEILEEWVQGSFRPDITLLLDLPVDLGLERAGKRSSADRFEQEKNAFFERVRAGFLQRADDFPERIKRVNAAAKLEQVNIEIEQILERFLA